MIAQAQVLRQPLQVVPVDEACAQDGQPAFGQFGETAVKLGGHGQLQDCVTEELQALVVRQPLPFFMAKRGMRKCLAQKVPVGKNVAKALLELF